MTRVSLQQEKHRDTAQALTYAARSVLKNCSYWESEGPIDLAMELLTRAKGELAAAADRKRSPAK